MSTRTASLHARQSALLRLCMHSYCAFALHRSLVSTTLGYMYVVTRVVTRVVDNRYTVLLLPLLPLLP
jgi:hypothetical protein